MAGQSGLGLVVEGVGAVSLPVPPSTAEQLCRLATKAPYGLGTETLMDTEVRDTWEIGGAKVSVAPGLWDDGPLALPLRQLKASLGLSGDAQLRPILDKLLVYGPGQFFRPHQDSERSPLMVGSLVVLLPSAYEGGALVVEHQGEQRIFQRLADQSQALCLLAFYSDCYHEVKEVRSGYRVALSYQLWLEDDPMRLGASSLPLVESGGEELATLVNAVQAHFSQSVRLSYVRDDYGSPQRLVYLLDHEYSERSLAWGRLKNGDPVQVAALRAAAEQLDCVCHLALAEVHETWSCEDDGYGYGYGRRRGGYRLRPKPRDPQDYQLLEQITSEVRLHHWLDLDGQEVPGYGADVRGYELSFRKDSLQLDPFESHHEGYQGNYGNTVEHWYHRAALVMWPRAVGFVLRAQACPQWAMGRLLQLSAEPEQAAVLDGHLRSLLPLWPRIVQRGKPQDFAGTVLQLALGLDDSAIGRELVEPLGLAAFQGVDAPALAEWLLQAGADRAWAVLQQWSAQPYPQVPAWLAILAPLCRALVEQGGADGTALARAFADVQVRAARRLCMAEVERGFPCLALKVFQDAATFVAGVLEAAVEADAGVVVDHLLREFSSAQWPRPLLLQVVGLVALRSAKLQAEVCTSPIYVHCIRVLRKDLVAGARAADDWSLNHPLACSCVLCVELTEFLRAKDRASYDWPLKKESRQHIHRVIDGYGLPVRHSTRRQGSPYVLQLRKDPSLFTREQTYRAQVEAVLVTLDPSHRSRFEAAQRDQGVAPDAHVEIRSRDLRVLLGQGDSRGGEGD